MARHPHAEKDDVSGSKNHTVRRVAIAGYERHKKQLFPAVPIRPAVSWILSWIMRYKRKPYQKSHLTILPWFDLLDAPSSEHQDEHVRGNMYVTW